MTTDLVHSIWKFIESPEASVLSDASPEQVIVKVIESLDVEVGLAPEIELKVREYLRVRIPLIFDILFDSMPPQGPCQA